MKSFKSWKVLMCAIAGAILFGSPAFAEIKVGLVLALTGPNSSLGIPYRKGLDLLPKEIAGEKVNVIILDDTSDPSTAVRNAHKLISEDKVDIIIGPSNTPSAFALAAVTNEAKVPEISLSPVDPGPGKSDWLFVVPQPGNIWILPIVEDIKKRGLKKIGFIGFSDPWGDLCFNALKEVSAKYGIEIVAQERYARTDNSVTGQVLKVLAAKPDAIFVGASGTPGALPHVALAERNWSGPTYGSPAVFNKDFIRIGGSSIEGVMAVTGPVGAWQQLPQSNPIKSVAAEFTKAYEGANGAGSSNGFAAYSFDAVKMFNDAVPRALKKAQPGTSEFRTALRDELRSIKELVGTQGVYTFNSKTPPYGVDQRSVVLVKVEKGSWKLVQ